ncbi:hypothetical protein L596_007230 [Steinernema carpocapsae]|uniref:AAA+ ATPase domain-containing protein n=1 Tax=Steinernema carpocapsae TaxID=34508 RepID=A0A4U5P8N9_STECR|nr:hypothetical protein L596_007230 [Steinernema carpocapsae]
MSALVGRESETAQLRSIIGDSISENRSLSCYISGKPGTGKTATVKIVTENLLNEGLIDLCYINCAAMKTSTDLYKSVAMRAMNRLFTARQLTSEVHKFFSILSKHLIIVLDEVDHLSSKRQDLLYTAFKWPSEFKNVILLGIANSLDLTERLLPKLKLATTPIIIAFKPYSIPNLQAILRSKFENEENIDPDSINLCARKVAMQTGDIRQAISLAEQMFTVMREMNQQAASVPQTPKANAISVVKRVISGVQDSPLSRSNIPQQPKIILATIIGLMRDTKRSYVLRDRLYAAYKDACLQSQVPNTLQRTEFASALQMLDTQGIVRIEGNSKSKICLSEGRRATRDKISADPLAVQVCELNFCALGLQQQS